MSDTAYLSVIVSGVVAIGSLIISPVINLIIEYSSNMMEMI